MEAAEKGMTVKAAIEQVLSGKRNGVKMGEIRKQVMEMTTLGGKTPGHSVNVALYTESKKENGLVVQTGPGTFKLNPKRKTKS